jgi:hypothetical protein
MRDRGFGRGEVDLQAVAVLRLVLAMRAPNEEIAAEPALEDPHASAEGWSARSDLACGRRKSATTSDAEEGGHVPPIDGRIAERHDRPMAYVALASLASRPGVASILLGARNVEQLQGNPQAVDLVLGGDGLAALTQASATPRRTTPTGSSGTGRG